YTVPQKINLNTDEKIFEIYFRVRKKLENGQINVIANGEIIKSFKREHMAPGEMEKIIITKEMAEKSREKIKISVSC
ncbi:MAG: pyridine nucleotide-disulfide oxidoreductase, partial [Oscillospiraceae bacterium]